MSYLRFVSCFNLLVLVFKVILPVKHLTVIKPSDVF